MSDIVIRLSAATSPVMAAKVYNPIRSEYYLKNTAQLSQTQAPDSGVKVTISDEAKSALSKTNG